MTDQAMEIFTAHSRELREALANVEQFHAQVLAVTEQLLQSFEAGGKVLVAGNGGSAAEAQHFSDEMVGRYKTNRRAYPVVALTADGAVLTCVGNDFGYEQVFSRQVEALGREGDVFIGLTTSGSSPNIMKAAETAREQGMTVIALTGQKGEFTAMADFAIEAPSDTSARVQEFHLHSIHLMCELFEDLALIGPAK